MGETKLLLFISHVVIQTYKSHSIKKEHNYVLLLQLYNSEHWNKISLQSKLFPLFLRPLFVAADVIACTERRDRTTILE